MEVNTDSHLIRLKGAFNARDLGGYPTCDGRETKKGVFLRADSLWALTEQDIDILRFLGVKQSIDLRSPNEINHYPSKLACCDGFMYKSIPMFDHIHASVFFSSFPETALELYIALLESCKQQYAQIFTLLSQADGAVLFHCTGGKDRTGIVSMLLLELANVPIEVILADYSVTEYYMKDVLSNLFCEVDGKQIEIPDYLMCSNADNMEKTIRYIRKKYKNTHTYLTSCGLDQMKIEMLLKKFIR